MSETANELRDKSRRLLRDVHSTGYETVRAELKRLIDKSRKDHADDVFLIRFLSNQLLVATAYFLGPIEEMEETFQHCVAVGHNTPYDRYSQLLIFAAWCEDQGHPKRGSALIEEASLIVGNSFDSTRDALAIQEMRVEIEKHRVRIAALEGD
ncbi:hypothetical protein AB1L42_20670 [Thalassoglobus sp. JC818]|uniref:hypothetical protein n=1 Tax=Thalassoglobus sp. JC818 TaxID=3232136 RepID=UPI0034575811